MDTIEGKVAVVTGAASGMGRAFAERFAAGGARLVLADVEEPVLLEAAGALAAAGAEVEAVVTDVSDPASVDALRDAALARFGRVNILCNNAGVGGGSMGEPHQVDLDDWRWVMGVNFWGVVHGHRAFLPHLMEHGDGHIVNTASMAGHLPGHSAYGASKFAVVGITEGLYGFLRTIGSTVGVSCLCPGFVSTNIMTSTRNRPEWAAPRVEREPSPLAQLVADVITERIKGGKPPAEVADLVADAILADRFWIFTDDEFAETLAERHRTIEAAENPVGWQRALGG